MPRPARPWFRFYVEAMWDRKLRRLAPPYRWLWVCVLAIARQSPKPGFLLVGEGQPAEPEDIADAAALRPGVVRGGLVAFGEAGMLEHDEVSAAWRVVNWDARQFESDDTAERTRLHRSRKRDGNVPTTSEGTPPETEADTESETPRGKPRDLIFEAVCEACGWALGELTKTARGRANDATKQLKALKAEPAEIHTRARRYRQKYPEAALTPQALTGNWAALANDVAKATFGKPDEPRAQFCDDCGEVTHLPGSSPMRHVCRKRVGA